MTQYINKAALLAEIKERIETYNKGYANGDDRRADALEILLHDLNTLEVKDTYEQCVQYDSIKAGIQAHAETYSFNIESNLFNQLTKEQQKLWRKEIEQACVSGGEMGAELARDTRYKGNLEVKEVDLDEAARKWEDTVYLEKGWQDEYGTPHAPFSEIGNAFREGAKFMIKAQKGE